MAIHCVKDEIEEEALDVQKKDFAEELANDEARVFQDYGADVEGQARVRRCKLCEG